MTISNPDVLHNDEIYFDKRKSTSLMYRGPPNHRDWREIMSIEEEYRRVLQKHGIESVEELECIFILSPVISRLSPLGAFAGVILWLQESGIYSLRTIGGLKIIFLVRLCKELEWVVKYLETQKPELKRLILT